MEGVQAGQTLPAWERPVSAAPGIEAHLLEGPGYKLVLVLNSAAKEIRAEVTAEATADTGGSRLRPQFVIS